MNASELAIYAPLWTAVPETRPTDGERDLICDGGRVGWATYDGRGGYYIHDGDQVPGFIAAALCRTKAEDWLGTKVTFKLGDPDGEATEASVRVQWPHHVEPKPPVAKDIDIDECHEFAALFWYRGPTIHHTLVAACLAVAGASA